MDRKIYLMLEGYMLECMRDTAHDKEHVYRVLNNAVLIGRSEENVDWDVLIASALLHDISRPEQIADPAVDHALHGGDKAWAFLNANGFDEAFCERVRQCIRTHRFRKSEPPASLEAKILFDADKLDVAGAIGIARTLAYNGETGRPIYTRNAQGNISDGRGDQADSFFREYRFKLEGICDHFMTAQGREMAEQRHRAAIAYYDALLAEVSNDEGRRLLDTWLNT